MMQNRVKYYHEINCIRGLATIAIVIRHTKVLAFIEFGIFPEGWFEFLTLFAVPLFFFLSGFSLSLRYRDNLDFNGFYELVRL